MVVKYFDVKKSWFWSKVFVQLKHKRKCPRIGDNILIAEILHAHWLVKSHVISEKQKRQRKKLFFGAYLLYKMCLMHTFLFSKHFDVICASIGIQTHRKNGICFLNIYTYSLTCFVELDLQVSSKCKYLLILLDCIFQVHKQILN